MGLLRKAIFRYKEKDSILTEIATNVVSLTENRIKEDSVLRDAFEQGNPISISKKDFDGFLKIALKGAGYVCTSNKIDALSDKVIKIITDKGYHLGLTPEGILISKGDSEIK